MTDDDASMRVLADHARATTFLMADGVNPSNEGRGYVLRRIMRRAIRHGVRLGLAEGAFAQLCGQVVTAMEPVYPELTAARELIVRAGEAEDPTFRRTLDRGMKLLDESMGVSPSQDAARRCGVQALRHLRLSRRPDAGHRRGAWLRRRRGRLRERDGQAARALGRLCRLGRSRGRRRDEARAPGSGRHRVPRLPHHRGRVARSSRCPARACWSRARRRSTASRAARWGTPARSRAKVFPCRCATPSSPPAT